ncbi:MAG: hypothetical protein GY771_13855 [bacterium]|nr:hypothetical protein [bacterium]
MLVLTIILLTAVNQPPSPDGLPDKGEGWYPDTFYHFHRFDVEVNGISALDGIPAEAGPEPSINLPMFQFDASPYSVVRFINDASDPTQGFDDGLMFCEPPVEGLFASHAVPASWDTGTTTIKNGNEDIEVSIGRLKLSTNEPERGSFAYSIHVWFAPAPEDSYVIYAVSGTAKWALDDDLGEGSFTYKLTNGLEGEGLDIGL